MLRAGYTSVCEFHYLHHDAVRPATRTRPRCRCASWPRRGAPGIGPTMLPVLYQTSGFGAKPPREDQKRFLNEVDGLLRIVEACCAQGVRGVAPHFAARRPAGGLKDLLDGITAIDASAPIHIHVAEQMQ